MAQVYLKGIKNPVYIPDERAKKLKADFDNGSLPVLISIDSLSCRGEDIKGIVIEGEQRRRLSDQVDVEYKTSRTVFRNKSVEEKANNIKFFENIWYGFNGNAPIPDHVIELVVRLQAKFFSENPFRMWPDPSLFKSLFREDVRPLNEAWLRFLERQLATDIEYAFYKN